MMIKAEGYYRDAARQELYQDGTISLSAARVWEFSWRQNFVIANEDYTVPDTGLFLFASNSY